MDANPTKTITKKFTICEAPQVRKRTVDCSLPPQREGTVYRLWATWCGGCRQIIKEYEPLKRKIGEDKVAFHLPHPIPSSKKDLDILIQDIAGEHYWLNKRTMGLSLNHFQMTGLTDVPDNR